jgi:LuxR family transcriptional regulator, maltose regulon positive regulatory protein
VDTGDNDPATFFHYMEIAARHAAPRVRTPLPVFTPEHRPGLGVFARRYFEALYARLKAPAVLVLDNYQEVPADSAFHAVVAEAAAALPKGVRLLVLSRAEPPAAFARLRANEALSLLDGAELKLTLDEARAVANVRDRRKLDPAVLERLHDRTGGWMAGLVLLLERPELEAPAHAEASGHQVLFDYFATEIFHKLDATTQSVLCQAALLPEADAALARQISGRPGAGQILADMYRRNYFVTKQGWGEVYRFHPLFHEFLLQRAQETFPPAQLNALRTHAAALLEAAGDSEAAAALWRAASNWQALEAHVLKHAPALTAQVRFQTLETWLRALPETVLNADAWLLYWFGTCRLAFNPIQARGYLETAYERFKGQGNDRAGLLLAWCRIIDSFVYEWGDFHPVDRWIAEIESQIAEAPGFPSPEIAAHVACGMFMALMYRQPQHPQLPVWAERVQAIVLHHPDARARMVLGNQLLLYYTAWIGDLGKARLILDAVRPPENMASISPPAFIAWCAMEAGYHWFMAAHEDCLRAVNKGLEVANRSGVQMLNGLLLSQGVIGSLTAGDTVTAGRLLKDSAANIQGARQLDRAHYYYLMFLDAFFRKDTPNAVINARQAVALGDAAGVPFGQALYRLGLAQALFDRGERREAFACLAQARHIGRRLRSTNIEFGSLFTLVSFALDRGKTSLAINLLSKTLHMAKQHGYVNRPLWTPEIMHRLFSVALEHGIEVEYVRYLIRKRGLVPAGAARCLENWPWVIRVSVLGGFAVTVRDQPLPSSGKQQRKPLDLLKLLVASGERGLPVEQAAEALCPDMTGTQAYKSCAMALHRLRKLIGEDSVLTGDGRVQINSRVCWVDAWAFDTLLTKDLSSAAEQRLERAAQLYGGPFLNDESGEAWAVVFRERLHRQYLEAILVRGRELETKQDFEAALAWYRRGLEQDDLMETLYQRTLHCCHQLGQRAEGLATYERCRKRLHDALGIAPAPQTDALRNALIATR